MPNFGQKYTFSAIASSLRLVLYFPSLALRLQLEYGLYLSTAYFREYTVSHIMVPSVEKNEKNIGTKKCKIDKNEPKWLLLQYIWYIS